MLKELRFLAAEILLEIALWVMPKGEERDILESYIQYYFRRMLERSY